MARKLPEYLNSVNSDTVVVFIHGLGGSYNTWKTFSNTLSIKWNENKSYNLRYDNYYNVMLEIPMVSFIAKGFKGKSVEKLAEHLDSFIRSTCKNFKNIILICHSMGGLVARKYIVNLLNKERNLGKIKGLITYATPHLGSGIANRFKLLVYYPLKFLQIFSLDYFAQISDLSKNSNLINSINDDWNNLNVSLKLNFIRVYGLADPIVSEESAMYEMDNRSIYGFADKNHFNIIKPNIKNLDGAFYVTYNFLKDFNPNQEDYNNGDNDYPDETDMDY